MAYKDPYDERARASRREWYYRNRDKVALERRRQTQTKKTYLDDLKRAPCADCQVRFPPCVMDFDHIGDKEVALSVALRAGWSVERLAVEVDKCEVVCANCHRIRTFIRREGHAPQ